MWDLSSLSALGGLLLSFRKPVLPCFTHPALVSSNWRQAGVWSAAEPACPPCSPCLQGAGMVLREGICLEWLLSSVGFGDRGKLLQLSH